MVNTKIGKRLDSILVSGRMTDKRDELEKFTPIVSTLGKAGPPTCIIKPGNRKELQDVVNESNISKMNLTISSSRGPHIKGGFSCENDYFLVDLSGWDNIEWVNRRNRVCLIQPGVTYKQLLSELELYGMTISMPLAPRDGKSVLAAVMDREPSTWPNKQWDISDPVASTEFVLGNGEVFRTGAAGGPGSLEKQRAAGGAQKGPLGPSQADFHRVVQGAQGTMGILTWISMRTEIKPSIEKPFLLGSNNLSKLVSYMYEVQRPWLGEHSFILNNKALSTLMCGGQYHSFEKIQASLPPYICFQNIAGFERFPKERVEYQIHDIKEIAGKHGLELKRSIGKVDADKLLSVSTTTCGEVDFRHKLKGNCLSVFFLTTLNRCESLTRKIFDITTSQNLNKDEIGFYIQPVVQNHACHMEIMIPYDSSDSTSVNNMKIIENKLVKAMLRENIFFSRPYGPSGGLVFKKNPMNKKLMKEVKKIFDPNSILNRGKWNL